jgi:hypothetical protein
MGIHPVPPQRLTPHSLSRRVRDLLAGDLGAHRDLTIDDADSESNTPAPVPVVERTVHSTEDAQRAWVRRHADLENLGGITDQLDDVDRRVTELIPGSGLSKLLQRHRYEHF